MATALQRDVTREEDWRSATVKSQDVGEVDIVANNAGYFEPPYRGTRSADVAKDDGY